MNHFFRQKISDNLTISNFRKWINYYQIQQFFHKNFVLKNVFLMVSDIKEFIFYYLSIFAWGLIFVQENYLNETKFFWFKQNIFGPNKYLFGSNKFLPSIKPFISLTKYHWISCFVLKKNEFESNKYLFRLKIFCFN